MQNISPPTFLLCNHLMGSTFLRSTDCFRNVHGRMYVQYLLCYTAVFVRIVACCIQSQQSLHPCLCTARKAVMSLPRILWCCLSTSTPPVYLFSQWCSLALAAVTASHVISAWSPPGLPLISLSTGSWSLCVTVLSLSFEVLGGGSAWVSFSD